MTIDTSAIREWCEGTLSEESVIAEKIIALLDEVDRLKEELWLYEREINNLVRDSGGETYDD